LFYISLFGFACSSCLLAFLLYLIGSVGSTVQKVCCSCHLAWVFTWLWSWVYLLWSVFLFVYAVDCMGTGLDWTEILLDYICSDSCGRDTLLYLWFCFEFFKLNVYLFPDIGPYQRSKVMVCYGSLVSPWNADGFIDRLTNPPCCARSISDGYREYSRATTSLKWCTYNLTRYQELAK
jgi:hypothetical protein